MMKSISSHEAYIATGYTIIVRAGLQDKICDQANTIYTQFNFDEYYQF